MSPQSIVCTTCDAAVPYGRLSCPACGELLASVAGAARPAKTRATTPRAARSRATERAPAVLVDVPPLSAVAAPPAVAEADRAAPVPEPAGPVPDHASSTYEPTRTGTLDWNPTGWDTTEPGEDWSTDEALEAPVDGSQAPASQLAAPGWEPPIFQPISGVAAADAAADPEAADAGDSDAAAAARGFSTVAWPADQAPPVPLPAVARP